MMEQTLLEQAIATLEEHRAILGHAVVDIAVTALRKEIPSKEAIHSVQQKEVSVLFANISGLTAMVEMMAQEQAYQTLNDLWNRLDSAIIHHEGSIYKRVGNMVVALFGIYTGRENEPEWAIRAALAMQAELRDFIREKGEFENRLLELPHLQLRIGIHTGNVLLSQIGDMEEYTVLGETVALASQLEHAAPVGTIFISHQTYQHVRGVFYVQPLGSITLPDKTDDIQIYAVRGAKPRAIRVVSRGVEGVETRLIGREEDLLQLKQALYDVIGESSTHVITISGETGLGKSRLLYEFDQWLELLPINMAFFQGRASKQTNQLPYWVIRDLFCFYFDIMASDPSATARQKLINGITEIIDDAPEEMATYIGYLIGLDFSEDLHFQTLADTPKQIRERAIDYVTQFFAAMTTDDSPVVIALEDIHWADNGSLDLIDHLAQTLQNTPLLIICPTHPSLLERCPNWGKEWKNHTLLELTPLSAEAGYQLADEILRKVPETSSVVRNLLVSRAEGNPLFMEELVKLLVEKWVILTGPNRWQIATDRLAELKIPPTLMEILRARIDRLPLLEREILQRASVIGRAFWSLALLQMGEDEISIGVINAALEDLQERELILKREASAFDDTEECVFKHVTLQEVTYESLLKPVQLRYHAQIAAWLIKQNGEHADAYAALIAKHYEEAERVVLAAEWFTRAGKQAESVYVPQVAYEHYQKALALWSPLDQLLPHQLSWRMKAYQGAVTTLLWQAQEQDNAQQMETIETALAVAQAGFSFAQETGQQGLLADAWRMLGQAVSHLPLPKRPHLDVEIADPATCFAKSLQLGVDTEDQYQQVRTLQAWAKYELEQGDKVQGEARWAEAQQLLKKLNL
jgi:class 3 adenylate cyclase